MPALPGFPKRGATPTPPSVLAAATPLVAAVGAPRISLLFLRRFRFGETTITVIVSLLKRRSRRLAISRKYLFQKLK